ncbi:aldehyde oxidoreductase [Halobacteriales archaeon QS_1_68_20]|nr:MAG: aldehyde oxidoreductase [Halobacteriales archaeon QS_1_68_20]
MDELPPLGFGTYDDEDSQVSAEAVAYALDHGYRHVDTAEMYGNEDVVGAGVRASSVDREEVVVATKLAPEHLAYDDAIEHAHASADRLGVDYLDLLYVHWPDTTYDPGETLPALDHLRETGLVREVGMCNCRPDQIETAVERLASPLFAHQVECHPLLQQRELRRLAREHDHYLVAYSPLAKGEILDVPELQAIAEERGATPAQVARIEAIDREKRVVDGPGAPWQQ